MDAETRSEVERALAGDRAYFESLIRRFGRLVWAKAYSMVHRREEAEDVVQETFMKAWTMRERLREPEKFPQWILAIARNACLDSLRRRTPAPMPEVEADHPDPRAVDPAGRLRTEELRRKLHAAMDTLPEHYRLALTLRYMEGLDYHGIEQAMGISNGAVRGILARTLQTMRKALKPWIRSEGRPSGLLPLKN